MKIEQLLVQHFYQSHKVTLQGMGTFSMSPDLVMPKENDKDAEIPENAISFEFNARATADDALIDFIVRQTGKMRALAAADLESYLVLGNQFLNIGKPFKIEGIGMLAKNQHGELQFTQGNAFGSRLETNAVATKAKTELHEQKISFQSDDNKSKIGKKRALLIAVIVVALGLAGASSWYFFFKPKNNLKTITAVKPTATSDTAALVQKAPNSVQQAPKDSTTINPAKSYTFKVVFRVLSKQGAIKKMQELNKPYVVMYTSDSIKFKLAEIYTLPLADTARIKDSLRKFYDFNTFIELK